MSLGAVVIADLRWGLVAQPLPNRRTDDDRRDRPIRRLGVTRRALFEELDRLNLKSLPAQSYRFAEWRVRRIGVEGLFTYALRRATM